MKLSLPLVLSVGVGFAVLTELVYSTFSDSPHLAYALGLAASQVLYFVGVNVLFLRKHGWREGHKSVMLTGGVLLVATLVMLGIRFSLEPYLFGKVVNSSSVAAPVGIVCGIMAVSLYRSEERNACQ